MSPYLVGGNGIKLLLQGLVVTFHVTMPLLPLRASGQWAVCIYFIISGYLNNLKERPKDISFWRWYIEIQLRRTLPLVILVYCLYPLYWLLPINPGRYPPENLGKWDMIFWTWTLIPSNLKGPISYTFAYQQVTWFLSCLFLYQLIYPFIMLIQPRASWVFVIIWGIVDACPLMVYGTTYLGQDEWFSASTHLAQFMLGVSASGLEVDKYIKPYLIDAYFLGLSYFCYYTMTTLAAIYGRAPRLFSNIPCVIGLIMLATPNAKKSLTGRIFENRWINRQPGSLCLLLYLIHFNVYHFFTTPLKKFPTFKPPYKLAPQQHPFLFIYWFSLVLDKYLYTVILSKVSIYIIQPYRKYITDGGPGVLRH